MSLHVHFKEISSLCLWNTLLCCKTNKSPKKEINIHLQLHVYKRKHSKEKEGYLFVEVFTFTETSFYVTFLFALKY